MGKRLVDYTLSEQQAEIRALIAHYDERGLDWVDIVGYHAAVFTGRWPIPRPEHKGGRPRKQAA